MLMGEMSSGTRMEAMEFGTFFSCSFLTGLPPVAHEYSPPTQGKCSWTIQGGVGEGALVWERTQATSCTWVQLRALSHVIRTMY